MARLRWILVAAPALLAISWAGCDQGTSTPPPGTGGGGAALGGGGEGGAAGVPSAGGQGGDAGAGGRPTGGTGGEGGDGGDGGSGGTGPVLAQACPPNEYATGISGGVLQCASVADVVADAVIEECSVFAGWRDDCEPCGLLPDKWGHAYPDGCTLGAGMNDTCTEHTLGGETVDLFGLNTDGTVNDDDTFFGGLHCADGAEGSSPGPCEPGELLVDISGSDTTCALAEEAVLGEVRSRCFLYLGWRDDCYDCDDPPAKWGRANDALCVNGFGFGNSCVEGTLDGQDVRLFGLLTEGEVNDDDKFYVGLRCPEVDSEPSPSAGPCPPGEFVVGVYETGELACASLADVATSYFRENCTLYFGWSDACSGCTTGPTKWGRVREDACELGAGDDDTCTKPTLGGSAVDLFGLNTDGSVADDDTFFFGLHCD